jgi:hypothetical protein
LQLMLFTSAWYLLRFAYLLKNNYGCDQKFTITIESDTGVVRSIPPLFLSFTILKIFQCVYYYCSWSLSIFCLILARLHFLFLFLAIVGFTWVLLNLVKVCQMKILKLIYRRIVVTAFVQYCSNWSISCVSLLFVALVKLLIVWFIQQP